MRRHPLGALCVPALQGEGYSFFSRPGVSSLARSEDRRERTIESGITASESKSGEYYLIFFRRAHPGDDSRRSAIASERVTHVASPGIVHGRRTGGSSAFVMEASASDAPDRADGASALYATTREDPTVEEAKLSRPRGLTPSTDRLSWRDHLESVVTSYAAFRGIRGQQLVVLKLYLDGKNDKEIAAICRCSTTTIYEHWRRMAKKLGATLKSDVVADFHRFLSGG
jgi:DNA-binding CsgD family transcriptional regulator